MKSLKVKNAGGNKFCVLLLLVIALFFESCANKMTFLNSSVVPAAEGSVKIKKDKNNNYTIQLHVTSLADPKRLDPQKNVYVVWMKTEQNGTKNIGELKTSSSLLSKMLKSSLTTVTPFKPTSFFITAEDNSNIQDPLGKEVLWTAVN
jgi:hypothetical protein